MSDKSWIHCCACESEWLYGSTASFNEDERCPYCDVKGQLRLGEVNKCPNCEMGRMAALAHLTHLVGMAEGNRVMRDPTDKHYSKALRVVKDLLLTVCPRCKDLTSERDALQRQLDLQLKLHGVVKQHIADSIDTAESLLRLSRIIQRDIVQAIETLEDGDIGGAMDQLRALVNTD